MRDSETSLPWYIPRERSKMTMPDPAVPMERLAVTVGSLSSPARIPFRCMPVMTLPLIVERQRPLTTTAHPDTSFSVLSAKSVVTSPVATNPSMPAAAAFPVKLQRSMRPPARSEQRMNTEEHASSVQPSMAGVAFSRRTTPLRSAGMGQKSAGEKAVCSAGRKFLDHRGREAAGFTRCSRGMWNCGWWELRTLERRARSQRF